MFKWLYQVAENQRLRHRISELESALEKMEWKCEQLEKETRAERKKTDKYVLEWSNACAKLVGQPKLFTETKEKVEHKEVQQSFTEAELAKFEYFAELMRNADIDAGKDAPPLSTYLEIIKEDPKAYIFS